MIGAPAEIDLCPGFDDHADIDADGMPDGCDPVDNRDDDHDGVINPNDICVGFDDHADIDADGTPDGCDSTPNGDITVTPPPASSDDLDTHHHHHWWWGL